MTKKAHGYIKGIEVCEGYAALNPNNCAVRERTADGKPVGPCCFHLEGGTTCPRHGKVKAKGEGKMTKRDVIAMLPKLRPASEPGKKEDGTRVHLQYHAADEATPKAVEQAKRADELGLPKDRYTGRVSRIWKTVTNDQMLTVYVELERDHQWRSFNLDRGDLLQLVVLGE